MMQKIHVIHPEFSRKAVNGFLEVGSLALMLSLPIGLARAQEEPAIADGTRAQVSVTLDGSVVETCEAPSLPKSMRVIGDTLRVRKEPSFKANIAFQLYKGMELTPLERKSSGGGTWIRFQVQGADYWIAESSSDHLFLMDASDEKAAGLSEDPETFRDHKLLIDKKARTMTLLRGDGRQWNTVKVYPIGLSGTADIDLGAKERSDDGRTPEGHYYFAYKNPASHFGVDPATGRHLPSILISYPNSLDAWRGLKEGLIDLAAYQRITVSVRKKGIPDQGTELGNSISIHGGDASDWTLGCVAMNDSDMKELMGIVKVGIPIEIK